MTVTKKFRMHLEVIVMKSTFCGHCSYCIETKKLCVMIMEVFSLFLDFKVRVSQFIDEFP